MDHYPLEEIPSRSSRSDGRPYLIIISLDGGLIGQPSRMTIVYIRRCLTMTNMPEPFVLALL